MESEQPAELQSSGSARVLGRPILWEEPALSTATLTAPWRGLSSAVWILVVARAVNRIGAFTLPFLGVVLSVEFGASLTTTGLILAMFGAATIPSRLLGGQLADRLGAGAGWCGCRHRESQSRTGPGGRSGTSTSRR